MEEVSQDPPRGEAVPIDPPITYDRAGEEHPGRRWAELCEGEIKLRDGTPLAPSVAHARRNRRIAAALGAFHRELGERTDEAARAALHRRAVDLCARANVPEPPRWTIDRECDEIDHWRRDGRTRLYRFGDAFLESLNTYAMHQAFYRHVKGEAPVKGARMQRERPCVSLRRRWCVRSTRRAPRRRVTRLAAQVSAGSGPEGPPPPEPPAPSPRREHATARSDGAS